MNLKKIAVFYAIIFFPLTTLVLLNALGLIKPMPFSIALAIYAFLYHPFISGKRLISLNAIKASNLWYNFIPM